MPRHFGHGAGQPQERRTLGDLIEAVRCTPRTLKLVWSVGPLATCALCFITVLLGILPAASAWVGKLIIDSVLAAIRAPVPREHLSTVLWFVALECGLMVVQRCLGAVGGLLRRLMGLKLTDYVAGLVHRKTIGLDLEYFENTRFHDRLPRAQQEAGFRPMLVLRQLMAEMQSVVTLVAFVGILVTFDWHVVGILLIVTIPSLLYEMHFSRRMFHWFRARTGTERKSHYMGFLLSFPEYAKELRLFRLGSYLADMYQTVRGDLRRERIGLERKRALANLAAGILAVAGVYFCYGLAGFYALMGAITLGEMTMYYRALLGGQRTLQQLLGGLSELYESNLFLTNLYELLALEPTVADPPDPLPIPKPMREGIVLENVHFRYPGADEDVLKGINLTVRPGERIALVGENGAGKTTLVKLLCRLYDPTSGRICLDGADLNRYGLEALHDQVGVIFQDFVRYEFTVRENIALGDVDYLDDMARIEEAARRSGAHDIIQTLPKQYETQLGQRFSIDGFDLSIGQWQKIALARAFMRRAQILILDEPTASLDARAEYEVFQRFRELTTDRAAVLISHRFSTVRMADHIYVMHDGSIVEHGAHEDLMALGGRYARLFEMQASSYV